MELHLLCFECSITNRGLGLYRLISLLCATPSNLFLNQYRFFTLSPSTRPSNQTLAADSKYFYRNSHSENPSRTKTSSSIAGPASVLLQQLNSRVNEITKTCGITGGVGWIGRGGVKARMMMRTRSRETLKGTGLTFFVYERGGEIILYIWYGKCISILMPLYLEERCFMGHVLPFLSPFRSRTCIS